jgi:hypothetical protein
LRRHFFAHHLEEDILGILPQHDSIVDEYKYTIRKFHQIDRVYIDVGINQRRCRNARLAADEFYDRARQPTPRSRASLIASNSAASAKSQFSDRRIAESFHRGRCERSDKKLETHSIRAFLTTSRRKLAGPEGMVLKDVIAADPIGMSALVIAKVVPLQTGFGDAHVDDGRLTSSDGKHVLMMAEPKFPSADSKQSAVLVAQMLRVPRAVENNFPGVHVAITGGHRMSLDNATLIRRDATHCMILAFRRCSFCVSPRIAGAGSRS